MSGLLLLQTGDAGSSVPWRAAQSRWAHRAAGAAVPAAGAPPARRPGAHMLSHPAATRCIVELETGNAAEVVEAWLHLDVCSARPVLEPCHRPHLSFALMASSFPG